MMTLADFLAEALNHDNAKQLVIQVEGSDGYFTMLRVDPTNSNTTTLALAVLR